MTVGRRCKTSVCGHSLAGMAGSNSTGSMESCLSGVYFQLGVQRWADHSFRGVVPTVVYQFVVIQKPQELGGPGPRWAVAPE